MTDVRTPTSLLLPPEQPLHLRPRRPLRLRALRGTLWITVDGELDDHVLQPGDCRVFAPGSRLLVTAMQGPAELRATLLPAAPWWRERLAALFGHLGGTVRA